MKLAVVSGPQDPSQYKEHATQHLCLKWTVSQIWNSADKALQLWNFADKALCRVGGLMNDMRGKQSNLADNCVKHKERWCDRGKWKGNKFAQRNSLNWSESCAAIKCRGWIWRIFFALQSRNGGMSPVRCTKHKCFPCSLFESENFEVELNVLDVHAYLLWKA